MATDPIQDAFERIEPIRQLWREAHNEMCENVRRTGHPWGFVILDCPECGLGVRVDPQEDTMMTTRTLGHRCPECGAVFVVMSKVLDLTDWIDDVPPPAP